MRYIIGIILVLCHSTLYAQSINICSWNLQNLGKSKTQEQINTIAKHLRQCDLIAIQEINTGDDGKSKVQAIVKQLNQGKKDFDYSVSEATTSDNPHEKERYAYIWNKQSIKTTRKFHLDQNYEKEIIREPYVGYFSVGKQQFTLFNFHAVPAKKNPQQEIAKFKFYKDHYKQQVLVFIGDFNTKPFDNVFNPLKKQGYVQYPENQSTTIRQQYTPGNHLANPYDHIWLPNSFGKVTAAKIIPFYESFGEDMKAARKLSDHVPIKITLQL